VPFQSSPYERHVWGLRSGYATLPAAEAAGTVAFQLVDRNYCAVPVKVTLPVLVRVNASTGSGVQPTAGVGQLRAWAGLQFAGVRDALTTAATPVPVSVTGEPIIATFEVIVRVEDTNPIAVGEKATVMVQLAPAARVAPHVPSAAARA
jgi:hypothetical protein